MSELKKPAATPDEVKALLLQSILPHADVEIPGKGTVTVRGLSRSEVVALFDSEDGQDTGTRETRVLASGLVHPAMTEDEVLAWRLAATHGEIDLVSNKILRLSGLLASEHELALPFSKETAE